MTRGSSPSGQRRKVEESRRLVREALGDAARLEQPPKYVPLIQTAAPAPSKDESVIVLTNGEVAARRGISRREVERMVSTGKLTRASDWVHSHRADQ